MKETQTVETLISSVLNNEEEINVRKLTLNKTLVLLMMNRIRQ